MTITTSQFIAVNVGTVANDGTGDDLRTSFIKVNNFFANIADIGFDTGNISATGAFEVAGNITAGNVSTTNLYGLIQTPTQSQITSLGTLTGLTSSGITYITDTTESLQFNSGALIIDGGVGIAKDVYIKGNLYVANALATTISTLVTTSPLVNFDTIPEYPYNFDIGFYSRFVGGVGNVSQYTGLIRNDTDHTWYLFSNVAPVVYPDIVGTQMSLVDAKYEKLVLGNIVLNAPTPTAITNGGTTATGNIGASGATFNYGYFTNLTGTLQTTAQNTITSASALATVGTITTGKWSGLFGAVSGANLTILTADNLIGTVPDIVLGNSTVYVGTTAIALNRAIATQTLTGVSIDGTAGAVSGTALTGTVLASGILSSSLTTVGTLSTLAVTGVSRTGGIIYANSAVASTSTTTGGLVVAGGVGVAGNVTATNLTGTLTTPTQPAITSLGTLSDLTVTNPIAGSITGSALTVTQAAQPAITSLGTLSSLTVTGNVAANYFIGNGAMLTGIIMSSVGTLASLNVTGNITAGNVTATNLIGHVATPAQSQITSLGTLTALAVTGNVAANYFTGNGALLTGVVTSGPQASLNVTGAITVNSSNAVTAIINGGLNGGGNIGASGQGFNTVYATAFNGTTFSGVATTAKYADLAENYLSDSNYEAGTVVVFGGAQEITTTVMFADATVAGVISTDPAYLMNSALDGQPVALRGRVPVKVQGFTRKGDLLVTGNIPGTAISVGRDIKYGQAVFAKALENKTTAEVGVIEAVII